MFRALKSLGSSRVRKQRVVGLSLNRTLAVASLPATSEATDAAVQLTELPTESAGQVRALSKIVTDFGVKGCAASITLSPGSYEMLQIERPPVKDDELVEATRWRVASMLEYPVEEAVIQVFDAPQPSEHQREPMLNVVAAPARAVRDLASVVSKAGLAPRKITVAELAIRDLVTASDTILAPVVTVFLTGRQGLIQVTHDGKIYLTRRLGYGLGSVKPAPASMLETGIQNTLPLELRRTIDYFDSHYSAGNVRKILAGPAEAGFMAFMQEAGNMIGLPVEVLEPAAELLPASGKPAEYGMPEAYLALGGALSLRDSAPESLRKTSTQTQVAV